LRGCGKAGVTLIAPRHLLVANTWSVTRSRRQPAPRRREGESSRVEASRRTLESGREQQRGAAIVGDCFVERPSAAPLPRRLRKQHRDGAAPRWSRADSRTVGAIQQSAVRGGTLESRPNGKRFEDSIRRLLGL
jgi:hypothetical protein